jgi:hypothetical protein
LEVNKAGRFGGRRCGMGGMINGDEEESDEDDDVEPVDMKDDG